LTHVINAMRSWLVGTEMGNSAVLGFIWSIGIIIVCMPIAAAMFRRHR
jgi:ABC-2 type transport system permease protein